MSLKANQGGGAATEIEIIPEGKYDARLVGVIDIGTQKVAFNNETSEKHQVRLVFAIPSLRNEYTLDDGTEVNKPRFITKKYTLSLHEKATLTKDLITWRDDEALNADEVDLEDILNETPDAVTTRNATIRVEHKVHSGSGNTWAHISTIRPMNPKGNFNTDDVEDIYFTFATTKDGPVCTTIPDAMGDYRIMELVNAAEWNDWFMATGYELPDSVKEKMGTASSPF